MKVSYQLHPNSKAEEISDLVSSKQQEAQGKDTTPSTPRSAVGEMSSASGALVRTVNYDHLGARQEKEVDYHSPLRLLP